LVIAQQQHFGLLSCVELPLGAAIIIAILMLVLALYFQHLAFHHAHFLWRPNCMHHADLGFGVTIGNHFDPIEMILPTIFKMAVILLLGAPIVAVIIF